MHEVPYLHGWTRASRKEFYYLALQFFVHLNVRKLDCKDIYVIDVGYSRKGKRAKKYGDCLVKLPNIATCPMNSLMGVMVEIEEKYVVQNIVDLVFLSEDDKNKLRNL